jgi:hypothetical protein
MKNTLETFIIKLIIFFPASATQKINSYVLQIMDEMEKRMKRRKQQKNIRSTRISALTGATGNR